MVSEYQHGNDESPQSEPERFLKTDMHIAPIVRGIEDKDRIMEWWNVANWLDVSDERKEMIQVRMDYLND